MPATPFLELILPATRDVVRDASKGYGGILTRNAVRTLRQGLAEELSRLLTPYYFTLFSAFRSAHSSHKRTGLYQAFLSSSMAPPAAEVLSSGRTIGGLLARYAASRQSGIRTMLANYGPLQRDRPELGRIVEISGPLSEVHGDGGAVCCVVTEDGPLVYKPRSIAQESRWATFLSDLQRTGVPHVPAPLRILRQHRDAGWIAWVAAQELSERKAAAHYYRRAGVLLFWIWLLQGRDMVGANIIAAGDRPVLVDCETLCYPLLPPVGPDRDAASFAVTDTGMLPALQPVRNDRRCVFGALSVKEPRPYLYWTCKNANSNRMRYCRRANRTLSSSIPRKAGRPVLPQDELESLVEGFLSAAHSVCDHKRDVADLIGTHFSTLDGTRIVLRPTAVYAALVEQLLHQPFTPVDPANLAETLAQMPVAFDVQPEPQGRLIQTEVEALMHLMVPAFYSSARTIAGLDVPVPGARQTPILRRVRELTSTQAREQAELACQRIRQTAAFFER